MAITHKDKVLKHIPLDQLAVGMYVEDVFDRNGIFLLSAGQIIEQPSQIEQLRERHVASVFIDVERSSAVLSATPHMAEPLPRPAPPEPLSDGLREQAYYLELDRAREVHRFTLETVKEALRSMRMGRSFSTDAIKSTAEEIVGSIMRNPDALVSLSQIKGYDEYTYTHSVNVGVIAASLSQAMGYSGEDLLFIGMGGLMHDIGKMRVPESILNKPGKLTDAEFNVMKRHPEAGAAMLRGKRNIHEIVYQIIEQHHERYNGKGYPRGLHNDSINEIGVISAVADVYDALTSDRVYREAWTPQKALATIFQGSDRDFARHVVELFTKHLGIYPVGSFVRLFSGEMGVVVRVDRGNLLAPTVLILFDALGNRLREPVEYNLAVRQRESDGDTMKIQISLNPRAYEINVGEFIQGGPVI